MTESKETKSLLEYSMGKLWTAKELEPYLKMSERSIRKLIKNGKLPSAPGTCRVSQAQLLKYLGYSVENGQVRLV